MEIILAFAVTYFINFGGLHCPELFQLDTDKTSVIHIAHIWFAYGLENWHQSLKLASEAEIKTEICRKTMVI